MKASILFVSFSAALLSLVAAPAFAEKPSVDPVATQNQSNTKSSGIVMLTTSRGFMAREVLALGAKQPTDDEVLAAPSSALAYAEVDGFDLSDYDAIERIRVSPASDSNLLTVSFRSSDPQLARDVVNALVDEFMRFSGDMKQSRALNFFSDVSRKLALDLAEAESALLALRSSTRSYAPEQQRGMLLSQLSEASERARSFEVAKAELRGRISALQARLADEPAKIVVREQTRRDPTVDALRAKLAELTHRRATVGRSGDSGSIPARQLDTEIAALRSAHSSRNQA